jgi:metallophosphoesterase superfamily enzyme
MPYVILSDIHLEFLNNLDKIKKILLVVDAPTEKILIIAGDIGHPDTILYSEFIEFCSKTFKKTFFTAGNHEFYNSEKNIDDIIQILSICLDMKILIYGYVDIPTNLCKHKLVIQH